MSDYKEALELAKEMAVMYSDRSTISGLYENIATVSKALLSCHEELEKQEELSALALVRNKELMEDKYSLVSENEKLKAELSKGTEVMFTALRTENQKLKGKLYGPKGRDAELTALRAERDELISGLEYILTMDRTKGYPTGVEWGILVSRIKGFLSKHPKRGEVE